MKLCGPFEDGSFASVATSDGRSFLAYQAENQIRVRDLATSQIIRVYDSPGGAAFPLLKPNGSPLLLAWRRGDDARIRWANPLTDESPHDLGDIGANNEPFCWDGDWLWWQDAIFQIKRQNLVSGGTLETMPGQVGRGTGLSRVVNGRVVPRDFDRVAFGLTFPCYAGDYVALEGSTGGTVILRQSDEHRLTVWPSLDGFMPKIVGWSGGVLAATAGSGSVRAAIVAHTDLSLPVVEPPTQPPPVTPPPTPEPEPDPEPGMQLPENVKSIRDRYVARFPVPQGVPGDAVEEACRQWSRTFSQQVCFETNDARWGMKNAGGGRPTSKDTVAFDLGDGRIRIWDLITGAGTGRGTLVADPHSEDITGQQFEPQPPVDHLGVGQPPPVVEPPPVTPPPVTPPPSGDVLARLSIIEAKLDLILAKLSQPLTLQAKF